MEKKELEFILKKHKNWLESGGKNGERAYLSGTDLRGAGLEEANLRRADLTGVNLEGANLIGADLTGVNLEGADLTGAFLGKAIFREAILEGINLEGADLFNSVGNGKQIKTIHIDKYTINYTINSLQIGCRQHSIEEWKTFADGEIAGMGDGALEWWKKWKNWLFQTIEMSPAKK